MLDNQSAVAALQTGNSTSSIAVTRMFYEMTEGKKVTVKWIPGHSGIKGNEEADKEARAALSQLPPLTTYPENITLAYLRRLMQQKRRDLINV